MPPKNEGQQVNSKKNASLVPGGVATTTSAVSKTKTIDSNGPSNSSLGGGENDLLSGSDHDGHQNRKNHIDSNTNNKANIDCNGELQI
jgi:hypothetical protein